MNNAPAIWDNVAIADFGEIVGGGTPSRTISSYWDGSVPWVTPSEITALCGKYISDTKEKITQEGLAGSAARLLPVGSVVVTTRATLGETAIAAVPLTTNQGFKSIIPNEETDSLFAYYRIQTLKSEMVRLASGTTFLEVSKADFSRILTRRPKRPEQSRIAAILDKVDEAIAKTGAVITKLRQVRAGLLHDFLTCGLDQHGQLRDPIAHPEQFQDSPLGQIPNQWVFESLGARLQRIGGAIQTGPFGSQLHANEYVREGIPVIMPQDILMDSISIAQVARIPIQKADELRRHRVKQGDVIFSRRGDLSRCVAITPREVGWLCGTGCLLMRFNQSNLSSTWLSLIYRHDLGQRQVACRAVGTTMVNLNQDLLFQLKFGFPERDEQDEIVRRIAEADTNIGSEADYFGKLVLLKSGLTEDLLSGRVRVAESIGSTS